MNIVSTYTRLLKRITSVPIVSLKRRGLGEYFLHVAHDSCTFYIESLVYLSSSPDAARWRRFLSRFNRRMSKAAVDSTKIRFGIQNIRNVFRSTSMNQEDVFEVEFLSSSTE